MSVSIRESMRETLRERPRQRRKGRKGGEEEGEGMEQQQWWLRLGCRGPGPMLTKLQQRKARPLQSPPLLLG